MSLKVAYCNRAHYYPLANTNPRGSIAFFDNFDDFIKIILVPTLQMEQLSPMMMGDRLFILRPEGKEE